MKRIKMNKKLIDALLLFILFNFILVTVTIVSAGNYIEEDQQPTEDYYSYYYCYVIPRWENNNKEVANENFHGVQVDGVSVDFPWNGYINSYEWCSDTYDYVTEDNVEYVICDVYMSMNTCDNIVAFKEEIQCYQDEIYNPEMRFMSDEFIEFCI